MPVDPIVQKILDQANASPPPDNSHLPLAEQRRIASEAMVRIFRALRGPGAELERVEDRSIAGPHGTIPVRVYTPGAAGPLPALVYFHGGAWWLGDLEQPDAECRDLAAGAGCVVVSVDYRLAPEHKFPVPLDDCYAATCWVAGHAAELGVDPARLAVGGGSAGANLAAAVALKARDRAGPALVFQLLEIPPTDPRLNTPSVRENGEGYLLTREGMERGWGHYLRSEEDAKNPYAAPAYAPNLSGLPAALVITCEYDPLRDEGEEYARRLLAAGVPTTLTRYDGMIHGSETFTKILPQARGCRAQKVSALRAVFGS